MICFFCKKDLGIFDGFMGDVDCPNCGTQNSFYYPVITCFNCGEIFEDRGNGLHIFCPKCGVLNEPKKKEEEMILAKFVKAEDYKTGDTLKFINEGEWVESKTFKYEDGQPKQQLQFLVEDSQGVQKTLNVNKTNREALIKGWGIDTKKWVGKMAEITIKEIEVAGEDTMVIRLEPIE